MNLNDYNKSAQMAKSNRSSVHDILSHSAAPPAVSTGRKHLINSKIAEPLIGGIDVQGDRYMTTAQRQGKGEKGDTPSDTKNRISDNNNDEIDDDSPLGRIKKELISRGARGIIGLQRKFKILDDDGSKSIGKYEFEKGIKELGLEFSSSEFKQLFDQFDRDKSGTIDFEEFLCKIRVSWI